MIVKIPVEGTQILPIFFQKGKEEEKRVLIRENFQKFWHVDAQKLKRFSSTKTYIPYLLSTSACANAAVTKIVRKIFIFYNFSFF